MSRRKHRKGNRSWTPFARAYMDFDADPLLRDPKQLAEVKRAQDAGEVEYWRNNLYHAQVNHGQQVLADHEGFARIVWISYRRVMRASLPRDWRDIQRLKNELVGPEREAVELFPRETRLVDESDQFHLWVLADIKLQFPFGYLDRSTLQPDTPDGRFNIGAGSQRPFEFENHHPPVTRCETCARLPEHCSCEATS